MKAHHLYLFILLASAVTSCKLSEPPNCVTGAERCESNEVITGTGIYQVCSETGEWGDDFVCAAGCKDDLHCSNDDESMPKCSEDGKIRCKTIDDITLAFNCRDGLWLPSICYSNQCSEESGCIDSTQACEGSSSRCIDVPDIGSVQIDCIDQKKTTFYCPKGITCDGDKCADGTISSESVLACGEEKTNCTQSIEHWKSGRCTNGACIVTECESGYHPYEDELQCEENTNDNCGVHGKVCATDKTCDTSSGKCECTNGLKACGTECVDISSNLNHCGECNQDCVISNSQSVNCEAGSCKATKCETGYHLYNNQCEQDSNSNCGQHDKKCTKEQFEGSATVSCENAQCVIKTCDSTHQLNGGKCIDKCSDDEFWDSSTKQCEKRTCSSMKDLNVGDTCYFGRYMYDSDGTIKPLEWLIISIDNVNNRLFMITLNVIDFKPYNEANGYFDWYNCTLRSWLNGFDATYNKMEVDYTDNSFKKTAFNSDELESIIFYNHPINEYAGNTEHMGITDVDDYVFNLSLNDATTYLTSETRKASPTEYAKKNANAYVEPAGCTGTQCKSRWWLRDTILINSVQAESITPAGNGDLYDLNHKSVGIRPALWIKR